MTDGNLTLTYSGGDDCGGSCRSETIVTLRCDECAMVISSSSPCALNMRISEVRCSKRSKCTTMVTGNFDLIAVCFC